MRDEASETRGTMDRLPVVGRLLVLAALPVCMAACQVRSLHGPNVVTIGGDARYTMEFSGPTAPSPVGMFVAFVIADVPENWSLASNEWTGTINGAPASGTATVVPPDPSVCPDLALVASGYQRLYLMAGPFTTVLNTDSAELSLRFQVGGPPGDYVLSFWGDGISLLALGPAPCQDPPTTLNVAAITPTAVPLAGGPAEIALVAILAALGVAVLLRRAIR